MTLNKNEIYHGDCLQMMKAIENKSIDMILCDLPYGTTMAKWDEIIPFEPLWEEYERIVKDNGSIVLTATQPFTTKLIASNIKLFRYEWIWKKSKTPNFIHAKNMPLKKHENILVFSKSKMGHKSQLKNKRMNYNPQGLKTINKKVKGKKDTGNEINYWRPSQKEEYIQEWTNYPTTILEFESENDTFHPTQKPVALFEYLIKTYTNEGDTVLDNCIGSGTTAIACLNSNRFFIGMEQDETYFNLANERVENWYQNR